MPTIESWQQNPHTVVSSDLPFVHSIQAITTPERSASATLLCRKNLFDCVNKSTSGSATCKQNRTSTYDRMLSRKKKPTSIPATRRGTRFMIQPVKYSASECACAGPREAKISTNPAHNHHARRFHPPRKIG